MIKKRPIIFCLVKLIFLSTMLAQGDWDLKPVETETIGVKLINGSYIIGELVEESSSEMKLVLPDIGDVLLRKKDIVDLKRTSDGYSFTPNGRFNYDKGFYVSAFPFGIHIGRYGVAGVPSPHLQIGRHHNARLSYGLMVSYLENNNYYRYANFRYWFTAIPVAGIVNVNINLKGPRVYVTGKLGHAFKRDRGWFKEVDSGMYASYGIGMAMPTRTLARFTVELESTYIKSFGMTSESYYWFWQEEEEVVPEPFSTYARYFTIKLGIAIRQ